MFRTVLLSFSILSTLSTQSLAKECEYRGYELPAFFVKDTEDGEFVFVLVAENCEVVATSETYTSKQNAEKGIESVRRIAPNAEVHDITIDNRQKTGS